MNSEYDNMITSDRSHIWHPYASMLNAALVYPVVSASGVRIKLADGRELIDGMASWWCAIHGYNHPVLNSAIEEQLGSMSHIMFGGLTHQAAIDRNSSLLHLNHYKPYSLAIPDPLL